MKYDIERHPQWDRKDSEQPDKKFFAYVLTTKYGHYVGHTGHLHKRLNDHATGKVQSTYGGRPRLIWRSKPFPTREMAATFERALKVLRDRGDPVGDAVIHRTSKGLGARGKRPGLPLRAVDGMRMRAVGLGHVPPRAPPDWTNRKNLRLDAPLCTVVGQRIKAVVAAVRGCPPAGFCLQ